MYLGVGIVNLVGGLGDLGDIGVSDRDQFVAHVVDLRPGGPANRRHWKWK